MLKELKGTRDNPAKSKAQGLKVIQELYGTEKTRVTKHYDKLAKSSIDVGVYVKRNNSPLERVIVYLNNY